MRDISLSLVFFEAEGTASFLHEVFISQNLPFQIFQFDMCREPLLYGATGSCDGLNKFAELMSDDVDVGLEVFVGSSGQ